MLKLSRITEEPPFRLATYFYIKRFAKSIRTIERWAAVDRPHYLSGILAAADQALKENVTEISVIEFGVAGGSGLLELQKYADAVELETGVKIKVYGFDTGEGLPEPYNDYRDHPDQWKTSDYKMDVKRLQQRLLKRSELCLGNIADTVPKFVSEEHPPVGFIGCDVDLYSSTREVLRILDLPNKNILRRVFIYFDDIDFVFNHRFAGELLAIDEFNEANSLVKIDKWRGLKKLKIFADQPWLDKMYIAHDLNAINKCVLSRAPSNECSLR